MSDEFVDDFADQEYDSPNARGLPVLEHSKDDVWKCRVCGYGPNIDRRSPFCISCGRDYYGNRGTVPDRAKLALEDLKSREKK